MPPPTAPPAADTADQSFFRQGNRLDPDSQDNALQGGMRAEDLLDAPTANVAMQRMEEGAKAGVQVPTGPTMPKTAEGMVPPQPTPGTPFSPPPSTSLDRPEDPEDLLDERERGSGVSRGMVPPQRSMELYRPPDLEISDSDVERLEECIVNNHFYSEKFTKGRLSATFRVKSANEVDFQRACLGKMAQEDKFGLVSDYQNAVAQFNLLFQLADFNGKSMPQVRIPPRPWSEEALNLETQFWMSPVSQMTDAAYFLLQGMMVQFEDKLFKMQQRLLDPNFSKPDDHSS